MMTNFHLNTTVVAIFPNVCLWRRSLCSDLVLTLKNRIEPPSYARTAYVVAIWPSFLFDSFVKFWATCEAFLGKWFTTPPSKKFPVRLCKQWHIQLSGISCDTNGIIPCSRRISFYLSIFSTRGIFVSHSSEYERWLSVKVLFFWSYI